MTRLRLMLLAMAVAALLLVAGTASSALASVDNQLGPGFEHLPILTLIDNTGATLAVAGLD